MQNPSFLHGHACRMFYGRAPNKPVHSGPWRENKEHGISYSTTMTFLPQHNYPVPLFLEQDIVFFDDAVPLIVHMSALSLSTGAFRRTSRIFHSDTFPPIMQSIFLISKNITVHRVSRLVIPGNARDRG